MGNTRNDGQEKYPPTCLTLLEAIRNRDQESFRKLETLYQPYIAGICRRKYLGDADCEDVTQEVLTTIWTKIDQFRRDRPGDTFRGWVRQITQRKIYDLFREGHGVDCAQGGTEAQIRMNSIPESTTDEHDVPEELPSEKNGVLLRALELIRAEFESHTWQCFWRTTVDQCPGPDVAAELQMSTGAVRNARYKVLKRLKAEFGELL